MPKVSVIIPTYNLARFVGDAVQSVLNQTLVDLELIVVDDGSTDDTPAAVAGFADSRLHYIYQVNQERSVARNTGIRFATGQFIALLDADDQWLPEKLERQVAILESAPQVGLVYTGAYVEEDGSIFFEQKSQHRGRVVRPLLTLDNIVTGSASTAIVRRECFVTAGLFDERSSVCEDWDLWLRIALQYDFDFVPQPLARLRVHQANTQKQAERMARGTLAFFDQVLADPGFQVEVEPIRAQVRSLAYLMAGKAYFTARQMGTARAYFVQSLRSYPAQTRAWTYLALSLLGSRSVVKLRSLRNRVAHLRQFRGVE